MEGRSVEENQTQVNAPEQEEVTTETTLGEIVRDQPTAAAVFETLGFDFCCGGGQSLAEASAEKGLDPSTVAVMLAALPAPGSTASGHDLSQASIPEICDHIVSQHHERFRESAAKLTEIIATVVRVHGPDDPDLANLESHFTTLRDEMLRHAAREETELFPAVRASAAAGSALNPAILDELEDEHLDTGRELAAIREICGDYDLGQAYCGTHRLMLTNLRDLEEDTHQHVHEENNILFPLIRSQLEAA